jgi:hypothetical protein
MAAVDKAEAYKQAWIKAEAAKIAQQLQAKQIADLVDPGSSEIVKKWIKEEVEQYMGTLKSTLTALIDDAVSKYCEAVFEKRTDDEHFMLIARGSRRSSIDPDSILSSADFIEAGTRPPSRAGAPINGNL